MAMEVGADLANMNEAWWYPAGAVPGDEYEGRQLSRFVAVERTAPHSIMVDRFGHRFVNEAANYNDMQKAFFAFDAKDAAPRPLPGRRPAGRRGGKGVGRKVKIRVVPDT